MAAILLAAALIELPALVGLIDYRRVLVPRVMGGSGPHNRQLDPELVYRHLPHDHFIHQQVGDSAAGLAIPVRGGIGPSASTTPTGFATRKISARPTSCSWAIPSSKDMT